MSHPIQIILVRQLATYLSVPLFLMDPKGKLLFYNEPAEAILGSRFDETGAMSLEEWSSAFTRFDDEGQPIPPEDLPPMITHGLYIMATARSLYSSSPIAWHRLAPGWTFGLAVIGRCCAEATRLGTIQQAPASIWARQVRDRKPPTTSTGTRSAVGLTTAPRARDHDALAGHGNRP